MARWPRLTNTWKARRQIGQVSRWHDGFDFARDHRTTTCRSRRNHRRLATPRDVYILDSKLAYGFLV